jgi:hypothetical protein
LPEIIIYIDKRLKEEENEKEEWIISGSKIDSLLLKFYRRKSSSQIRIIY